nr:reverse transcriptase domain-containing protein [Tanacetum cinerariifolium]
MKRTILMITSVGSTKQLPPSNTSMCQILYKDLLRACPHHSFTELHQLDTFYNALNPVGQDSLNDAVGGNLLERRTQDVLTIIENKSKLLELMLSKRSRKNTKCVNAANEELTAAKHKLKLKLFKNIAAADVK